MVPRKRLDYAFNGRRSPIIPKAPRSTRRRSQTKNSIDDNKLSAFELLATVAGKLLQESESSVSSNVEVQVGSHQDTNVNVLPTNEKTPKSESTDHGSCADSSFLPETSLQEPNLSSSFKELPKTDGVSILEHVPIEECVNSNMVIKLNDSVQLALYRDPNPHTSLQKQWNTVNLGIRDDDDNSFGCNKPRTKVRHYRPQPRTGHRRLRNMMTSKYRKMAPKSRSSELYNSRDAIKSFYQYRKRIYTQERCLQIPIKKRKLVDRGSAVMCDKKAISNSICDSPEKGMWMDKMCGVSATKKGHQKVEDPCVKFSIKSFKVPELCIELPETASVGSMKRTVMDAITSILGSGVRVGVFLHGEKVQDDNRTLQQAGISENGNLDTLGFTLEPNFPIISSPTTTKKFPSAVACDADKELLRSPGTPMIDSGISNASLDPPSLGKVYDDTDTSDFTSSPQTPTNEVVNGAVLDSKALIQVPPPNSEQLAVALVSCKKQKSELSQRRTRRPFSVGEVEALVEAVERLGTGRWRDVKMGAFENADHRTYVDLKDKWKTLVHTAGISPHQRRGEPVPQELLDRVLAAHSYWSQNHSKQHGKPLIEPFATVDPNKAK